MFRLLLIIVMTCPNGIITKSAIAFLIQIMIETMELPATSTEPQNHQNQIINLRLALENDIAACDIKWSLFVAAAQSYRYHSRLNPYPPKYATKEKSEYDIDQIRETISNVPPLRQLLVQINSEPMRLNEDVIDLVHWVVCSKSFASLKCVAKDEVTNSTDSITAANCLILTTFFSDEISVRFYVEKGRIYNARFRANTHL